MSDPFLGEIRMFAGNYAPRNWAFCNGELLTIADNQALYTLLGTTYGGSGANFALPDLRGRIPVHAGQGIGFIYYYNQGDMFGVETVTLTTDQIPEHNHPLQASQDGGTLSSPSSAAVLSKPEGEGYEAQGFVTDPDQTKIMELADNAVSKAGENSPHTNLMPTLCISFIISLKGLYPPRS